MVVLRALFFDSGERGARCRPWELAEITWRDAP